MNRLLTSFLAVVLACGAGSGCSTRAANVESQSIDMRDRASEALDPVEAARIAALRPFEDALRARLDPRTMPSSETAFGADPWVIRALPGGGYVGALRGRSTVVRLDAQLAVHTRTTAPRSTTGLVVLANGLVAAAGELSNQIELYELTPLSIETVGRITLPVEGIRDLATGADGAIAALDPRGARLYWIPARLIPRPGKPAPPAITAESHLLASAKPVVPSVATCARGAQLTRTPNALLVTCPITHTIEVFAVRGDVLGERPIARVRNDGPFFGIAASEAGDTLTIAAGGVEDHPLDRTEGSFGFIDSFVHVFKVPLGGGEAKRVLSVNVSDHGVVTPKALLIEDGEVRVHGYGTVDAISISLASGDVTARAPAVPGVRMGEGTFRGANATNVWANPLLDAWVAVDARGVRVVPVNDEPAAPRSAATSLGEALIFTTAIAPWNKSEGRLSRFTCETCHFEGTIDGRVHHTGRGDVRAATKPILGLFNNAPHFSRALDPSLSVLAMNEFRAANAKSDHDAYFTLGAADTPWLVHMGVPTSTHSPEDLRRAFMAFLAEYTHRPNPRVVARTAFSALEREGAEAFRERCEQCHAAKLSADADLRVPFTEWQSSVFSSSSPLVWGDAHYERTGVEPYVSEHGARVPSLRRVYAKTPYFTNGSAATLDAVLESAREENGRFLHRAPPSVTTGALTTAERRALKAFLEIL